MRKSDRLAQLSEGHSTRGVGRGLHHVVLLVVLLASGSLCRWGQQDASPAADEWEHLTRGVALWATADTRLQHDDPPLADAVATAVVAGDDGLVELAADPSWGGDRNVPAIASRLAGSDYANARAALMRARASVTWFLLLGILYAYAWALRMFGWPTAIAAATLIGLNPILVGQAGFLGEELPAAVTMLIAVGEFVRHMAAPERRATRWGTLPLALALALLTSHRAWALVPIFVATAVAMLWLRREPRDRGAVTRALGRGLGIAAIVGLALNAGYGFARSGLSVRELLEHPEPRTKVSAEYEHELLERNTPLPSLPRSMPVPLPYEQIFGLGVAWTSTMHGDPGHYYRGKIYPRGHWLYFPTHLVLKTPFAVLVLLGLVAPIVWFRGALRSTPLAVLVLCTTALLLIAMRFQLDGGVEQVLHIEALLCLLAAIVFGALWKLGSGTIAVRVGLVALLCGTLIESVRAGPQQRGWYNALVGRSEGHAISAVGDDVGQDRAALVELAEQQGLARLYVHQGGWRGKLEFTHLGLRRKDIKCRTMPRGGSWAAVQLSRLQTTSARCFRWARGRVPRYVVNDHVYVYWLPADYDDARLKAAQARRDEAHKGEDKRRR